MSYTYIIYSQKIDKYYIGVCRNDLIQRIENHNTGKYGGKSYTYKTNDWTLKLSFKCESFDHALRLERKIKSMKSRVYIQNLIKYVELRDNICNLTKST